MTRISIAFIQHQVAKAYGLDPALMRSDRRPKAIARPRQVAMWIVARSMPQLSLPQIGRAFGKRDHTTVMHALRKVDEIRAKDHGFAEMVDGLRLSIVQLATDPVTADQVAAERLAVTLADAFEVAVLTLARSNPQAALRIFTPLAQTLLSTDTTEIEEGSPCAA